MMEDSGLRAFALPGRAGVLAIDRRELHGAAAITRQRPLTVVTPKGPWAYAVSFFPEWPHGAAAEDGIIRVRMRVLKGELSVLCVAADRVRIIDEMFLAPTGGATSTVDLVAAPLGACDRVVVRHGAADEPASIVAIESLDYVALALAADGDRLPAPEHQALRPLPNWTRYYGGRGETLDERLRSARYGLLDRVKPMAWLEGLDLLIHPNDELSRVVYVSGTYEPISLLTMKRLLPIGGVFVDVGANVGLYAMLASRWVGPRGRVVALEPSAREFQRLRDHVELNHLTNIDTIRKGVADHDGWLQLRVARFPHAGHNTTAGRFSYGVVLDGIERVPAITLDRLVAEGHLSRVDLVKVDVEGCESAVLAGASTLLREGRPAWIVEVSEPALAASGTSGRDVLERLSRAGYRLRSIDESTGRLAELRPDEAIPPGNVIAVPAERD